MSSVSVSGNSAAITVWVYLVLVVVLVLDHVARDLFPHPLKAACQEKRLPRIPIN